ncbi:hypothetical protein VTN00DRAFT_4229 [Thermoascus crustaceus]|uniref:uncharacterized protein n=1 Tax=Thermoascus crustaceus TaxID=5088 RepID=UPI003742EC22
MDAVMAAVQQRPLSNRGGLPQHDPDASRHAARTDAPCRSSATDVASACPSACIATPLPVQLPVGLGLGHSPISICGKRQLTSLLVYSSPLLSTWLSPLFRFPPAQIRIGFGHALLGIQAASSALKCLDPAGTMEGKKMQLEDWLDDLCVRFIINLPREELESVERICFQVEEAQWFYEDFIRPLDPALPSLSLKAFAMRIFQHCPLMSQWSHYHHITAFSEFLAYKTRVPVRGAILLNEAMDEVVLVKGWKKGANWSFPRGKINKDEKDIDCAIREVYEETGFDIREAGLVKDEKDIKYIEITMREQHMRLYVFRGVPMDTHFEPRTRKEISKIEWYKLSELPTLKKSKHHDEKLAVANANKFYMVAPFLHPLKKWIAQQRKNDAKAQAASAQVQQTEGETSMDEAVQAANGAITPRQELLEAATPSDLPEVMPPQDVSSHLKRLLNISDGAPAEPKPSSHAPQASKSDPSKSNALLALLRSGSNGVDNRVPEKEAMPIPQAPRTAIASQNSQQNYSPLAAFSGASQPPRLPGQPGHPDVDGYTRQPHLQHAPRVHHEPVPGHLPQHAGFPHMSHLPQRQMGHNLMQTARQAPSVGYQGASGYPQHGPSQQYPNTQFQSMQSSMSQPHGRPQQHAPAPYQQTGDPQASQHQDHLLSLLKGSPSGPTVKPPAELPAQQAPSVPKQILQRSELPGNASPKQPAPTIAVRKRPEKEVQTSATVSGPLNMPHFDKIAKSPSRKGPNGTPQKVAKDRLASPITILSRHAGARKDSPVSTEQVSRPPSRPSALKAKTPEPSKPFQPQILRRSDKADLDAVLPTRTVAVHEFSQPQPGAAEKPTAVPEEKPPQINYDRRPSQTAAQRETLLSLFGKPTSPQPPPADLASSTLKPSTASTGASTLSVPSESGSQTPTPTTRVTSPVNKAFLLGYLEGVARGQK